MADVFLDDLDAKEPALGKALRGVLKGLSIDLAVVPWSSLPRISSQERNGRWVHSVALRGLSISPGILCGYLGRLGSISGIWEFAGLLSEIAADRMLAVSIHAQSPEPADVNLGPAGWSGIAVEVDFGAVGSSPSAASSLRVAPERLVLKVASLPGYSRLAGEFVLQCRETHLKAVLDIPVLPGEELAHLRLREPISLAGGVKGVTACLGAVFGPECSLDSSDVTNISFIEQVILSELSISFKNIASIDSGRLAIRSAAPLVIGPTRLTQVRVFFGYTRGAKGFDVAISGTLCIGDHVALACSARLPRAADDGWFLTCNGHIAQGAFPKILEGVQIKEIAEIGRAISLEIMAGPNVHLEHLELKFNGIQLVSYAFEIVIPDEIRFNTIALRNSSVAIIKSPKGIRGEISGDILLQPRGADAGVTLASPHDPAAFPADRPLDLRLEGFYGNGWRVSASVTGAPRRLGYIWRCFGGEDKALGFLKDVRLDALSFSVELGRATSWEGLFGASTPEVKGTLAFEYGASRSRIDGKLDFGKAGKSVAAILDSFGIKSPPDCLSDCVLGSLSVAYEGGKSWRFAFSGDAKIGARTFRVDIAVQPDKTSVTAKLVGKIGLGAFLDLIGQPAGTSGSDIALQGAAFRFSTSKTDSELQLVAAWSKGGRLGLSTARRQRSGAAQKGRKNAPAETVTVPSFVFETGGEGWLRKAHLLWSNADGAVTFPSISADVESDWTANFMDGISGEVAISLKSWIAAIADPVCIKRDDTGLRLRLDRSAAKGDKGDAEWEGKDVLFIPIAKPKAAGAPPIQALKSPKGGTAPDEAKGKASSVVDRTANTASRPPDQPEKPGATQAPESAQSGKPGWVCEKPISFGTVLDTVWPIGSGATPAWRQYAGNALVLDRLGFEVGTKPLSVTFFSNATINVGPWFSASVRRASLTVLPDGLAPDRLWNGKKSFDAEGAAATLNIPPWLKAQAAIMRYRQGETKDIDLALLGGGSIEIMEKLRIAALLYLGLKQSRLEEAFGFVSVGGIAIGDPSFTVTGIAGGFGYNCVLELPDLPEKVTDFSVVKLMRSDAPPQGADALFQQLEAFRKDLKSKSGAYCIAFGLTFRIAQLVDCLVLVVAEYRKPSLELAFVGLADFPLGAPKTGDTKIKPLGHLQLAIAGRFSSTSGTVRIIGKLTDKSWLFDESCRLTGSFAICFWFGAQNSGDFLVSLGGYSPLAPTPSHYPALERVGFTWSPKEGMTLSGGLYVALDRVGVQFGCAARLNYETAALVVQASFSFDAVLFWSPMYFEARMRISAVVDVRKYITTRLTLDIDMELWLPPFGARVNVKVSLFGLSYSATVDVGAAKLPPKATFDEVLKLARGGQGDLIEARCGSETPGAANKMPGLRSDEVRLDFRLAVPATRIDLKGKHWSTDELLDIRPMRTTGLSSVVTLALEDRVGKKRIDLSTWGLTPQLSVPTEALWFYPGSSQQDLARRSHRKAAVSFRADSPQGPGGTSFAVPVKPPRQIRDMPPDAAVAMPASRLTRGAFAGTAFDLEGCV